MRTLEALEGFFVDHLSGVVVWKILYRFGDENLDIRSSIFFEKHFISSVIVELLLKTLCFEWAHRSTHGIDLKYIARVFASSDRGKWPD